MAKSTSSRSKSEKPKKTIEAGGAVLWRRRDEGVEIGLVHRPRYDDWSHPKGKVDAGDDDLLECAVREVAEETGHRARVGTHVATSEYPVTTKKGKPATKIVEYWEMEAIDGAFEPNDEVDAFRWLAPEEAAELLTYDRDRDVLEDALDAIRESARDAS